MARDPRNEFDLVSVLAGLNMQILVQLVALILNAKLHCFSVAGTDAYGAIIRVDAHAGASSNGVVLAPVCCVGPRRKGHCGKQGGTDNPQPDGSIAVRKQTHG